MVVKAELNSSFLGAGVIDELSLVVAPVTANYADKSLFEYSSIAEFKLKKSSNTMILFG